MDDLKIDFFSDPILLGLLQCTFLVRGIYFAISAVFLNADEKRELSKRLFPLFSVFALESLLFSVLFFSPIVYVALLIAMNSVKIAFLHRCIPEFMAVPTENKAILRFKKRISRLFHKT
jgi:hypothetical protein